MRQLRRAERVIATALRRALPALRLAAILVPVWWLGRRVDGARVFAHLASVPLGTLALSLAWAALAIVFFTVRWRLFLRAWGATPPSLPAALSLVLRSIFWNLLPGGVVGDLIRSDAVRHSVGGLGNALAALWFERVGGLAGLFVVALGAWVFAPALPPSVTRLMFLGLAGSLSLLAVSLATTRSTTLAARLGALPVLGPRLGALTPPSRPRDLAVGLLFSLATQSAAVLGAAVVVHALAPAASLRAVVAVSPAAILLTFVPLTPAGIGQREAVFTVVFAPAGVGAEAAVAASVAWFGLALTFPLLGALLTLHAHLRPGLPPKG